MPAVKVKYSAPDKPRQWGLMMWMDIPSQRDPDLVYLRRLRVIQTPWFGVYLHWINEPDADRYPHDHPWAFGSMVINGAYTEEITDQPGGKSRVRYRGRWSIHRMPLDKAHRITAVNDGTMTLVLTGRRARDWCFWTDQGLVPWRRYLKLEN